MGTYYVFLLYINRILYSGALLFSNLKVTKVGRALELCKYDTLSAGALGSTARAVQGGGKGAMDEMALLQLF